MICHITKLILIEFSFHRSSTLHHSYDGELLGLRGYYFEEEKKSSINNFYRGD